MGRIHGVHWLTVCSCGQLISCCDRECVVFVKGKADAVKDGKGPRRVIQGGCSKCQGMRPASDAELAALKRGMGTGQGR